MRDSFCFFYGEIFRDTGFSCEVWRGYGWWRCVEIVFGSEWEVSFLVVFGV